MNAYRFNRYELFDSQDIKEVMSIIDEVVDVKIDNKGGDYDIDEKLFDLQNKLYGLFDGYLYDDLLTTAASIPQLSLDVCKRIEKIVDMVTEDILINGQRQTEV